MKLSVRSKNYVWIGSLLLLLSLTVTLASLFFLKAKLSAHQQLILDYTHAVIPAERLKSAMLGFVASERGFLLTGDPAFIERLRTADEEFQGHLNELRKWVKTPKGDQYLKEIVVAEKDHRAAVNKIHAIRRSKGLDEGIITDFQNEVFPRRQTLQTKVDLLVQHKEQELLRVEEESRAASARSVAAIIFSAAFSILLLGFCSLFLSRKLVGLYTAAKESEKKISGLASELSRSNAELERFASIASHDLRSPLNTITNFGTLLERRVRELGDNGAREYLSFIIEGAQKMRELVDNLLNYARVGNGENKFERTSLGSVIEDVKINLRKEIEASGAEIVCGDLPEISGDRVQLRQLFSNLISNSINYKSQERPFIRISVSEEGDEWRISVSDNGIGVEMQYAEQIFLPFKRLHAYQDRPGTGLGLPICRSVVERHGGKIWLNSEAGEGAEFLITLPKIAEEQGKAGVVLSFRRENH